MEASLQKFSKNLKKKVLPKPAPKKNINSEGIMRGNKMGGPDESLLRAKVQMNRFKKKR